MSGYDRRREEKLLKGLKEDKYEAFARFYQAYVDSEAANKNLIEAAKEAKARADIYWRADHESRSS